MLKPTCGIIRIRIDFRATGCPRSLLQFNLVQDIWLSHLFRCRCERFFWGMWRELVREWSWPAFLVLQSKSYVGIVQKIVISCYLYANIKFWNQFCLKIDSEIIKSQTKLINKKMEKRFMLRNYRITINRFITLVVATRLTKDHSGNPWAWKYAISGLAVLKEWRSFRS